MKTVQIECRKIEEWEKEVQEKIIEKHRYINVEGNWWEFVYETWVTRLTEMGYDVESSRLVDEKKYDPKTGKFRFTGNKKSVKEYNINFSGFYSQGDGASFTGTVDILKWLKYNADHKYRRVVKLLENSSSTELDYGASITRHGNYYHERSTTLNLTWYPDKVYDMPNLMNLLNDIERDIAHDIIHQSGMIYNDLEKEYEYLISDESIKGTLEVNSYEFDNTGEIW